MVLAESLVDLSKMHFEFEALVDMIVHCLDFINHDAAATVQFERLRFLFLRLRHRIDLDLFRWEHHWLLFSIINVESANELLGLSIVGRPLVTN